MSQSYGLPIIAIVGLIICVGSYLAYFQLQSVEKDPYAEASYQPARTPRFPEGWPKTYDPKSQGYEPHCEKPADREDSDLCAQWSAVKVVGESNRLSRVALNVNAIGLAALLFSLLFTGWAAWAAASAASAAEESNSVASETAKRQLRAYLDIKEVAITPLAEASGGRIRCDLTIRNAGQTPAHALWSCLSFDIGHSQANKLAGQSVVGPGSTRGTRIATRVLTGPEYEGVLRGTIRLGLWGFVYYTDAFEAPQHLQLTYTLQRDGEGWSVEPADNGNGAT